MISEPIKKWEDSILFEERYWAKEEEIGYGPSDWEEIQNL